MTISPALSLAAIFQVPRRRPTRPRLWPLFPPKAFTIAASAAILFTAGGISYAQQGTTLAGPAQGSKSDGSNSTRPSGASGANGGASGGATESGASTTR